MLELFYGVERWPRPERAYRFIGIWRRDLPPGPAASWLVDQFVRQGMEDVEMEGFRDL